MFSRSLARQPRKEERGFRFINQTLDRRQSKNNNTLFFFKYPNVQTFFRILTFIIFALFLNELNELVHEPYSKSIMTAIIRITSSLFRNTRRCQHQFFFFSPRKEFFLFIIICIYVYIYTYVYYYIQRVLRIALYCLIAVRLASIFIGNLLKTVDLHVLTFVITRREKNL